MRLIISCFFDFLFSTGTRGVLMSEGRQTDETRTLYEERSGGKRRDKEVCSRWRLRATVRGKERRERKRTCRMDTLKSRRQHPKQITFELKSAPSFSAEKHKREDKARPDPTQQRRGATAVSRLPDSRPSEFISEAVKSLTTLGVPCGSFSTDCSSISGIAPIERPTPCPGCTPRSGRCPSMLASAPSFRPPASRARCPPLRRR